MAKARKIIICAASALLLAAASGRAATVLTGEVTPPVPWDDSTDVRIGDTFDGSLLLDAGSQQTDANAYLGYSSGVTGAATVTGAGSQWTHVGFHSMNGKLHVGYGGAGVLRVDDGGTLHSNINYLGSMPASSGVATISGADSVWSYDFLLYVGYDGAGDLRVEAGAEVTGNNGSIAARAGSTGSATVAGVGSQWTNSGSLSVGDVGTGSLWVESGGHVATGRGASVGGQAGATGSVTISGVNSQWIAGGKTTVGFAGNGELALEAGGVATSHGVDIANQAGSTGALTVSGAGSQFSSDGEFHVGRRGSGTLRIDDGGLLNSKNSHVGGVAGSTAEATVAGVGSQWISSGTLRVGTSGDATLTVADGGYVTASTLYANVNDLKGNGMIDVNGAVLDADLRFVGVGGAPDAISFGSGGVLTVMATGGDLGVGYDEQGSLTIADGFVATSGRGELGYQPGSTGQATVTGAGSHWNMLGTLTFGHWGGTGSLRAEAGGRITSDGAVIGAWQGAIGEATITGAGAQWTVDDALIVGEFGRGSLRIDAGGRVTSSEYSSLADNSGATAEVVVEGPGSQWINNGELWVGQGGHGSLLIAAGGEVSNLDARISHSFNSRGAVTVTGDSSRWSNNGALHFGYGKGTLRIADGGLVTVAGQMTIQSNGIVELATGGMLALFGKADESLAQFLNLIPGSERMRYWETDGWTALTGATDSNHYALEYLATGELAGYTRLTITAPGPPGDFDGNLHVDGGDFLVWQRGESPSSADLDAWQANFGGGASPVTAVPEPAAWCMALTSVLAILGLPKSADSFRRTPV